MKNWHQYNPGPFVLGTAQLGLPYGITNRIGQPSYDKAKEIIDTAWNLAIRSFDTAAQYGTSEQILGDYLKDKSYSKEALIITKLPGDSFVDGKTLFAHTDSSLKALSCTSIFALLAHSSAMLRKPEQTGRLFKALKDSGKVLFTGISVYSVQEALIALEIDHFDLIQLPLNALDQKPSQLLSKAQKQNKLLLFRSAFLQGLLLLNPDTQLPDHMQFAGPILKKWWRVCQDLAIPPKIAALKIAKQLAGPYPLVIGAESSDQIRENVALLNKSLPQLNELLSLTASISESCTEQLLNPSLWPKP